MLSTLQITLLDFYLCVERMKATDDSVGLSLDVFPGFSRRSSQLFKNKRQGKAHPLTHCYELRYWVHFFLLFLSPFFLSSELFFRVSSSFVFSGGGQTT